MEDSYLDAVYFYHAILEAYELVGQELIGDTVLEEHVVPRMIYYVRNFLPYIFADVPDEALPKQLLQFLNDLKQKIADKESGKPVEDINQIWQLRAAIFGYESAFLEILGEDAIKQYVLQRISDVLAAYLPDVFTSSEKSLGEKLNMFATYIKEENYVKFANFEVKQGKVRFNVNHCAFASIHDSDAYREKKIRFCPWGMIVQAIVNSHGVEDYPIKSSIFATKGTITKLEVLT